jgi:nucleoside-diphosphate-sugar epimerase
MLRNTGVTSLTPQRGNQAMSVNVDGTRRVAENCDDEPRFLMALDLQHHTLASTRMSFNE